MACWVRFHPQAWINDCAVEVDAEGETDFDIGVRPPNMRGRSDGSDELRKHPNAPEWVRNWRGPFDIIFIDGPNGNEIEE